MENYKEKRTEEEQPTTEEEEVEIEAAISSLMATAEDLDEEDIAAVAARIQEEQEVLREFGY